MRVVICDDHRLFAETFASLLANRGVDVVACVATPAEAVRVVEETQVDVCIMDLGFPEGSGIDATARIASGPSGTQVVVLTASADGAALAEAAAAGASAVARKDDGFYRILDTIEAVGSGEAAISTTGVRSSPGPAPPKHLPAKLLTRREREVLERLARGVSTADLAKAMGTRYSTVRTHIHNILTKLGVHSKVEAVVYAVNSGLVPRPDAPPDSNTHDLRE